MQVHIQFGQNVCRYWKSTPQRHLRKITIFSCEVTLFTCGPNLVAHIPSLTDRIPLGQVNVMGVTETLLIAFWKLLTHIRSPTVSRETNVNVNPVLHLQHSCRWLWTSDTWQFCFFAKDVAIIFTLVLMPRPIFYIWHQWHAIVMSAFEMIATFMKYNVNFLLL